MMACGGGSSSSGGGGNTSTITSVTASCSPSKIQSGQTSQCSASVTGTGSFSSAVTWTASAGTITSSGLFTAQTVSSTTTVTVTASSTQDATKSGTATIMVTPVQAANNVQPIVVDSGPAPQSFVTVNEAFVTVTVCVPGSTTECQAIDHVLVDTGSFGLRLLSSAGGGELNPSLLPNEPDSNGNPLFECLLFLDGFVWGNVATADITMAGEKASSAPVQVIIPSSSSPAVPNGSNGCSSPTTGSNEGDSLKALGAQGVLGVGLFQQDCGPACTTQPPPDAAYYDCSSSPCNPTTATLAQQVTNPVVLFATDNNGVLIQLPAVPNGGSSTVNGNLIFGIGTQSNNGLGSANVYVVPDSGNNALNIIATFKGISYPQSFIDSGSNGIFFLNSSINGVPATCSGQTSSWYCPTTSPDNLTATNQGQNAQGGGVGSAVPVNFAIENANNLFSNNGTDTAFSTLGGPSCSSGGSGCDFDWGLAFFFGRNVFTAIDNMNTPAGLGPYYAY